MKCGARGLISMCIAVFGAACGSSGEARVPADASISDAAIVSLDRSAPDTAPLGEATVDALADASSRVPVAIQFASGTSPLVVARMLSFVTARANVRELPSGADASALVAGEKVIVIGPTPISLSIVPSESLSALPPESVVLRTANVGGATVYVATGTAERHPRAVGNIGASFAAYALLERLGFALLHPLRPTQRSAITWPASLDVTESPRWSVRGIQLHTMHPLELTHVLQGWGPGGWDDAAGWQSLLGEWRTYLEWLLANRQNRVHWVLLEGDSWSAFSMSETRLSRFRELVALGHDAGVQVGVDAPIALKQQNAFRLMNTDSTVLADQLAAIRSRIDWLMTANFDYVATETGTSEFTHPPASDMLAWMNEVARHTAEAHGGREAMIKIHCSTGQTAAGYADPRTGQDINFNMLPHFADSRLGVMPHTVQHYGFDDPAPTYGNTNFQYVREYMALEAGSRLTVWHPETAYWVSFDNDVPLFLPLYAERRTHDLRLIAEDERTGRSSKIDGQIIFSSGWEWGYWLNDVIAARAAYFGYDTDATDEAAFRRALTDALGPLDGARDNVVQLLVDTTREQKRLLIDGIVDGVAPTDVVKRNGQAYLQGFETWDDVSDLGASLNVGGAQMTQPERTGLVEVRFGIANPNVDQIGGLLDAMATRFREHSSRWAALSASVPAHARDLFDDMRDAAEITALRAEQVVGLYDYAHFRTSNPTDAMVRLAEARAALDAAQTVVRRREAGYRSDVSRIAGWGPNPTSYTFGYLWTVHSLHYWWRDEGKAVSTRGRSPCYLNIIDMLRVGLGEGAGGLGSILTRVLSGVPDAASCAGIPVAEPTYPPSGVR